MDTPLLPENRRVIPWHWVVLGLLIAAHAAFGAYFTPIGKPANQDGNIVLYLMMGFLVSQPMLFAIWAAFASQRFYHRFLWSFLLCTVVSFIEEIGALRSTSSGLGNSMMFDLTIFIVATMLLISIRRFSGWQIKQLATEEIHSDYQKNQFGIKHLIILTTITALACGLFRTLLIMSPDLKWLPSLAQFFGFACMMLALLFPVIVIPWYTLAFRGRIITLIFYTVITGSVCDLTAYLIAITTIPSPATSQYEEIIKPFILLQLGAALSVLLTTFVMRWCGFRMIRVRKAAAPAVEQ